MSHGLNKNSQHTAIFLRTIGNKIMSFGDGAIKDSNIDSIKHNYTKITNITSKIIYALIQQSLIDNNSLIEHL